MCNGPTNALSQQDASVQDFVELKVTVLTSPFKKELEYIWPCTEHA
jgi:hypothetical protein